MKIDRMAPSDAPPYENLVPLVEVLVSSGNVATDGGFVLNQAGWQCRFRSHLDMNLIRSTFTLPSSIEISEEFDSILDRLSWCVIEGPGAQRARKTPS
jgi:hypothetical protein